VKIDGKKDGDQMQITKKRLKRIIQEEVDRANRLSKGKENKINQIITIVESLNEAQLTQLHEMLKRNK
jgi:F0F1-type ATP synthase delta subunit